MLGSFVFWIPFLIQVPFISMRSFSEEYKLGTIEMLLTAPVREWEVVLSKFAAIVSLFVVLWLPLALDIFYVYAFSNQKFDIPWGMALLPFGMVLLLGMFFISICLFASSLTKNQVIAAILGFAFVFLYFCVGLFSQAGVSMPVREALGYVSCLEQMQTFCRGVFDTRPVVFYLSGTAFFLFLTQRVLEARRLRA
jgi:ABC-2 type transport system permease protein